MVSSYFGVTFFKWTNPGLFFVIFVLFSSHFKYEFKKHRCCAWGLNLGLQDGRHTRIHWTMTLDHVHFSLSIVFHLPLWEYRILLTQLTLPSVSMIFPKRLLIAGNGLSSVHNTVEWIDPKKTQEASLFTPCLLSHILSQVLHICSRKRQAETNGL